ncbi:MAG: hypothetical protein ABIA93_01300 [Candidatus Woesearchaeota archaeon]
MAIVEIMPSLEAEIDKRFKAKSVEVLEFLKTLEHEPKKGKPLGRVGNIAIKELKYEGYRFYFITDAYQVRFFKEEELVDLLLRFVRMSDKRHQQDVIDEIREVLLKIGPKGFG